MICHVLQNLRHTGQGFLHTIDNLQRFFLPLLHGEADLMVHGAASQSHLAVSHIVLIIQILPVQNRQFPAISVGTQIQSLSVGLNSVLGKYKFLLHRKSLPFRYKLQMGTYPQRSPVQRPIPDSVGDAHHIPALHQGNGPRHFHSLRQIAPGGIILIGELGLEAVSLLPFFMTLEVLAGQKHPAHMGVLFSQFQHFLQPVYHVKAMVGRMGAGHQHCLVIPAAGGDHTQGGEASQAIGHQIAVFLAPVKGFPVLFSI